MAVRVTCPSCETSYPVDDALRGKRVLCIHCESPIHVPTAAAAPPKPAPSAAVQPVKPRAAVQPAKPKPAARAVVAVEPDEDDAPVKRKPAPAKGGISPLVWVGCGALVLLVLVGGAAAAIVGVVIYANSDKTTVAKTTPPIGDKEDNKDKGNDPPDDGPVAPGQLGKSVQAKVMNATVYLHVTQGDGRGAQGSGFLAFEPGLVLTNAHVVGMLRPDQEPPRKIEVVLNSGEANERMLTGTVLGVDRNADLAVVRVPKDGLPAPLTVKTSADLALTQPVFIFGFPFGKELGKTVTVSATSVSSLRKGPTGQLAQVQVNGGMHPGNSGGPVVNAKGEVVGVSVAGMPGTQINFAVPSESVHALMQGRVANVGMGHTYKDGGGTKVRFQADLLDPLSKVKQVTLHWWVGPNGQAREGLTGPAPAGAGESARQQLPMTVQGTLATADMPVPPLDGNRCVWIQAALVNAAGQTHWSAAVPCTPYQPLNAEEVALLLKPAFGPRYVFLESTNTLNVSEPGKKDKVYNTFMQNRLVETTVATKANAMLLFLNYRKYTVSIPNELLGKGGQASFHNAMKHSGKLTAVVAVDNRNNIEMNEVDTEGVPPDVQKDLRGLHGQVQDSLEILSLPLPGKVVRPGTQWKAARPLMVFTGDPDDLAPMMVTYTFQGTHVRFGRTEAVVAIDGVSAGALGQLLVTGRVTGKAYFDVAASQITFAEVTAKVEMEKPGTGKFSASLVSKLERHMGEEILVKRGKLTPQSFKSKNTNCFAEDFEVQLEQGKTYHIGLECATGLKGPPTFVPVVGVADLKTGILHVREKDSNVRRATVYDYVAENTGKHMVRVTTQVPGQTGDFLVVVRRLEGSPKY
jgi:predicted Zn finger-like uncharacterized protein